MNIQHRQTPSHTVGPYFAYGLTPEQYGFDFKSDLTGSMVNPFENKDAITIMGCVIDGEGNPINDAMIELWQKDDISELFGRCGTGTDAHNRFVFHTIKPLPNEDNAPFITVVVFMRGQLIHSFTRLYFSDEDKLNKKDPVLKRIPMARRHTLIAQKQDNVYTFDIRMQGENETVFFDM